MTDITNAKFIVGELQEKWSWILVIGIIFLILGITGLGMTFFLTKLVALYVGFLIIIGGIGQLILSFATKGWRGTIFSVLIGILYLIVGIEIIANPAVASEFLTLLLAITILVIGISRIILALTLRPLLNWLWTLIGGLITVLLGIMILSRWPDSGLWVIGLFIAIEMIINGWSLITVALAAKATKA